MSERGDGERCPECVMRTEGILREVPSEVFDGLSCVLAPERFPARHRIYLEAHPSHRIGFVREGAVKLSKLARNGRTQIVGVVGPGFVIGHETLDRRPYRATAETLTPVTVCMTTRAALRGQIHTFPDVGLGLIAFLSDRVQELETLALHLGTLPTKQRVAVHLLSLLGPRGSSGRSSFEALPLSRQELADTLGMAKETLIRHLSRLAESGLIAVEGPHITVLQPNRLRRVAFG